LQKYFQTRIVPKLKTDRQSETNSFIDNSIEVLEEGILQLIPGWWKCKQDCKRIVVTVVYSAIQLILSAGRKLLM
jgi:hypothetical protein